MSEINVRLASVEDLKELLDMAIKFFKASPYAQLDELVDTDIVNTIRNTLILQSMGKAVILVSTDTDNKATGMLAAMASKAMWSENLIATEMAWWVSEDERKSGVGKKLVEGYEYWAKMVNAKLISLSTLKDLDPEGKLEEFYEKEGYVKAEQAFVKKVN
mgnify:CR=1 FL=1